MFEEAGFLVYEQGHVWRPFTRMDAYNKLVLYMISRNSLINCYSRNIWIIYVLFSFYGESGILSLMYVIMNDDTRLFIPACYTCSMDTNKLNIFVVEEEK